MTFKVVSARTAVYLLLILTTIIAVSFVYFTDAPHRDNQLTLKNAYKEHFRMKGIEYQNFENGRLRTRVRADQIKVDNRKFWIFNIRPFKEAVLENATFQVYVDDVNENVDHADVSSANHTTMLSFGNDLMRIGEKMESNPFRHDVVSRGVVNNFVLEIYDSGNFSVLARARKAYIDLNNRWLRMRDVSITDVHSGKYIMCRSAKWNDKERLFEIAGDYTIISDDGQARGNGISIDLNFDIAPLGHGGIS